VRDLRRSANGISQAFSALIAGFGGSQYGAIHTLAVTRPARGDASRRSNAAGSEVRAAAARHQSASLDKSGLGRRPSLKPTSRATRRRPRKRTRATGRLLEHPAEFAHRRHPIRSIEPEPVENPSLPVAIIPPRVRVDTAEERSSNAASDAVVNANTVFIDTVPDAASYAPVTILVDERADGVHISYDSMASLISPYGSEAALAVARDLDAKIESLLKTAAR
jgi:hypothetical protein